jgi:hypothetical protein
MLSPGYDMILTVLILVRKSMKVGISIMKREIADLSGRKYEAHSMRTSDPSDHI